MENYSRVIEAKLNEYIITANSFANKVIQINNESLSGDEFSQWQYYQEKIEEYRKLLDNARKKAMTQIVYNQLMLQNQSRDARRSNSLKDYVMLTVNPQPAVPVIKFVDIVHSFMKLCFIENGVYCFEQRSVDSNYYGFHTHILFKRCKKPSYVMDEIYRVFLPIVGNRNHIKVKSQDDPADVKNYIGYMRGAKKDPAKLPKVMNDANFRSEYGLKDLYSVGDTSYLLGVSSDRRKLVLRV